MKIYKIHPAFGIARLGDSVGNIPDVNFFHGPEIPGVLASPAGGNYRDTAGFLKRQGARFRIFEYDDANPSIAPREIIVGGNVSQIKWTVHLANKKAFWHKFNGLTGEDGNYPPNSLRNGDDTIPVATRRQRYVIDFGPRTLSAPNQTSAFTKGTSVGFQETFPGPLQNGSPVEITTLGEIQTDADGHLTVLGGHGISGTRAAGLELPSFVNNREWFDDTSDGPVTAEIVMADGTPHGATPAWVIITPPDFAPVVENVVTLYDVVYDLAVRNFNFAPTLFANQQFSGTYEPSFTREVYPILRRASDQGEVQQIAINHHKFTSPQTLDALSKKPFVPIAGVLSPARIFAKLRDPANWHETISDSLMPKLFGDENEESSLTLTPSQYHVMRQWSLGIFQADWPGSLPQPPSIITPDGLDRAALEACAGGGFFPGIEAGWIMRRAAIYQSPFRFHPEDPNGDETVFDRLTPGSVTMRSAVPWQADFFDCQVHWWPAQRPDQVRPTPAAGAMRVNWHRGIARDDGNNSLEHLGMVTNWSKLGILKKDPVTGVNFEDERTLP
jgi:L-Lysine epsilon oxidase N-terminal/L-lysine epsilon oxidase C-terminal domain